MRTVLHLNLRVDPTQYIPQIRNVPGYDYIHLVRQPKHLWDLSLLNDKVYYLSEIHSYKEFVEQHNIALIHAHHAQLGMLLLPFKEETGLPLVTSIRGRDATMAEQPVGYDESMKLLFQKGELFLPVCRYLAERIIDWGCPPEKVRILYGGVDLARYEFELPPMRETQNILSVGRLVEKKGHHILMKAFKKIQDKYPKATLTVIGSGKFHDEIVNLAKKLKLGDSFQLLDRLPKDEVRKRMREADLFCAASLTATNGDVEGIPNTLKEAMALGIPVISTDHAGIPELITNGREGVLVPENDVDALAEALEYMLENRHLWRNFAILARYKIEKEFDQEKQLALQARYYDELLGGRI